MRHRAGTLALRAGAKLRQVQDLLGHKDPRTTSIYTHVVQRWANNPALKLGITIGSKRPELLLPCFSHFTPSYLMNRKNPEIGEQIAQRIASLPSDDILKQAQTEEWYKARKIQLLLAECWRAKWLVKNYYPIEEVLYL